MEMKNRSYRYDINRSRSRLIHKYSKYKMSQYENAYIYQATLKQYLKLNS